MDKYNAEGYPDPTAAEALKNVTREEKGKQERRLIYVCSPYSGETQFNTRRARGYSLFVVSKGHVPLAPHLLFPQFLDEEDKEQRELGLSYALFLLQKCNAIWVFGSKVTDGMSREIIEAKKRNIPIKYFNERCVEVKSIWK